MGLHDEFHAWLSSESKNKEESLDIEKAPDSLIKTILIQIADGLGEDWLVGFSRIKGYYGTSCIAYISNVSDSPLSGCQLSFTLNFNSYRGISGTKFTVLTFASYTSKCGTLSQYVEKYFEYCSSNYFGNMKEDCKAPTYSSFVIDAVNKYADGCLKEYDKVVKKTEEKAARMLAWYNVCDAVGIDRSDDRVMLDLGGKVNAQIIRGNDYKTTIKINCGTKSGVKVLVDLATKLKAKQKLAEIEEKITPSED